MPKLKNPELLKKKYKMINMRFEIEEADSILLEAKKENRNITNFIKNCIKNYLNSKINKV